MSKSTAADKHYDRDREVELFRTVLGDAPCPRVITVVAGEGEGKSWLLRHFEEIALEMDPPPATSRATVKDDPELIWLVEQISDGLESSGAPLKEFLRLNIARGAWDYDAFGLQAPPTPNVSLNIVESILDHSPATGAELSGALQAWPEGHERAARQACLDALLDELRDLSRTRTVVVLLDQFERATDPIEAWLHNALLNRVLADKDPFGQLVLVVASSRPVLPKLAKQLGPDRRAEHLRPIEGLSRWEDVHIREWVDDRGLNPEIWVEAVRDLFARGASVQTLRMIGGGLERESAADARG